MRTHPAIGDVAASGFRGVANLLVRAVSEIVREADTGHTMKLPMQRGTKEGRGKLASHELPDDLRFAPSKQKALKELVDYAMRPSSESRWHVHWRSACKIAVVSNTRGTGKSDLLDRLGERIESEFASQARESRHFKVCNVLVITMNGHIDCVRQ